MRKSQIPYIPYRSLLLSTTVLNDNVLLQLHVPFKTVKGPMKLHLPEHSLSLLLAVAESSSLVIHTLEEEIIKEGIFMLNAPCIEVVFKIDFN